MVRLTTTMELASTLVASAELGMKEFEELIIAAAMVRSTPPLKFVTKVVPCCRVNPGVPGGIVWTTWLPVATVVRLTATAVSA